MKVAPNMRWAEPYVKSAARLVPLHRVSRLRGYEVKASQQPTTEASIVVDLKTGKASINVALTGSRINAYGVRMTTTFEVALLSLAHELAHLVHWGHTPEHLALMSRIMIQFSKVAKREGVKDTSKRLLRRTV